MNKKPADAFYRHLIKDAWELTKKNKLLWVFGFFVSFLGNGGIYELLIQGTGRLALQQEFGGYFFLASMLPSGADLFRAIGSIGAYNLLSIIALVLIGIVLLGIAIWVIVVSQGSLVTGIREAMRGRKLGFSALFAAGAEVFKPLLALNVLSRIAMTAVFYLLLAFMVFLMAKATLVRSLIYLLAFLVLIPVTLVIGFITIYAASYVALYRFKFFEAIETAFALFKAYWLISLETAAIVLGINLLAALALAIFTGGLSLILLPLLFGAALLPTSAGLILLVGLGSIVVVGVMIMFGSFLAALQYSIWTLLFIKLNTRSHGAVAKTVRVFHRWFGKR